MAARFSDSYTERGLDFVRAAMCIAKCDGQNYSALNLAQRAFGKHTGPAIFIERSLHRAQNTGAVSKAAIAAANTLDTDPGGDWAGSVSESAGREFIGVADTQTIFGKVGMTPGPLNTRLVGIGTGAAGYWRAQGKPTPVTQLAMNGGAFPPLCVSALCVVSEEILKIGDPASEMFVRAEMLRAMRQVLDTALIDPANSGTTQVKPASLLNGVTAITATGDTEYDLKAIIKNFPGDFENAVWVARPETFASLNSPARPFVGVRGGELLGAPCIASKHVPQPAGGEILALIDGSGIVAGDDGIEVETSNEGSLEMLDSALEQDATDGTGAATAGVVSLWQLGAVGIQINRRVNWNAIRPSVSYIEDLQIEEVSA